MKYSNLKISNFRSLTNLEIDDLKQINLIVGKNNCGKSSVLEAFFLTSGMSNPRLPVNVHNLRDLTVSSDEDFIYLFHNLDFDTPIELSGIVEGKKRSLTISPIYVNFKEKNNSVQKNDDISTQEFSFSVSTNPIRAVEGLQLRIRDNKNNPYTASISIRDGKIKFPDGYKEVFNCRFLNAKSMFHQMDNRLETLLLQKNLSPVINILKNIEPNLSDIRMGAQGMLYVDIGIDRLLPINVLGDGFMRILSFLAAIADMKNGVLLIDEIENGLHYSSLSIMWKAIAEACKTYNVQLIATTHSYDCINSLGEIFKSNNETDIIRLYRIGREDNNLIIRKFDSEILKSALDQNIEVR